MNRPSSAAGWRFGILLLALLAGTSPPSAQTTAPVPTYPKDIAVQPQPGDGLTLRPAPAITQLLPERGVVQGERLRITGNLTPHELVVTIGNPAVRLPIIGRSQGPDERGQQWVLIEVPASLEIPGAPLVARHGTTGAATVVAASYRVVKRPVVARFQILNAPVVNLGAGNPVATRFRVDLADYVADLYPGDANRQPLIRFPDCGGGNNIAKVTGITAGNPAQIEFEIFFGPDFFPGGPCTAVLFPYGVVDHFHRPPFNTTLPGRAQLPALAEYVISDTTQLLTYTSPSGRTMRASASNGALPCQSKSIGTAGTFNTGIVNDGGDLAFVLRSGAIWETCLFRTTGTLEVRDDWRVETVEWTYSQSGSKCYNSYGPPQPDPQRVKPVEFRVDCSPVRGSLRAQLEALEALPDNSPYIKNRLERVVLRGPANRSWQQGFK